MHHNLLLVPFEQWHLDVMDFRDEQKPLIQWSKDTYSDTVSYGDFLIMASIIDTNGDNCAWTILQDGYPILSGGIYELTPYMGQAWVIASKDFVESSIKTKVWVTKRIKEALELTPLKRVQADTEVWFEDAQKFLEALGFEREGLAKCYTPFGEDSILYGKIKEDT